MSETITKPAAPAAPPAPESTEPATFGVADLDLCGAGYPILPVGIPCPETGLYRERNSSGDVHEVSAGTVLT